MANTLKLTFAYKNSENTKLYNFDVEDSFMPDCEDEVKKINASLQAGTAGGLSSFFLDADGNFFEGIKEAKIVSLEEEYLNIGGASS